MGNKQKTLKEEFMSEDYSPSQEELVDHMVDIFDDMMKGSISDQKYQKMINEDILPYSGEEGLKLVMTQAKQEILRNVNQWLSREIKQQTE